MMQGAFFLPCSNRSRTRLAPTPTNISTKSEPEMEKNGTLASPATARASKVLPVPGDPTSSTPLGIRPPSFWNFCASRRNSIISLSSSLASSTPATSLNVIFFCCMESRRARLFPNDIALFPPICIWRIMKNQNAANSRNGPRVVIQVDQVPAARSLTLTLTPLSCSGLYMSAYLSGAVVWNTVLSVSLPRTSWPFTVTSAILPSSTYDWNCEKLNSWSRCPCVPFWKSIHSNTAEPNTATQNTAVLAVEFTHHS